MDSTSRSLAFHVLVLFPHQIIGTITAAMFAMALVTGRMTTMFLVTNSSIATPLQKEIQITDFQRHLNIPPSVATSPWLPLPLIHFFGFVSTSMC
jgi:hypothetical protein